MNQEKATSPGFERKPARPLSASDILHSTYIKRPGNEPSGILTKYGEATRVRVFGVVSSIEDEKNVSIDDGTGSISIRSFEQPIQVALGEIVFVIGKPREWENSKYIVPEIVSKTDKSWVEVHKKQLQLLNHIGAVDLPVSAEEIIGKSDEIGPHQKILNVIAILDKGAGADVDEIISHVKIENSDTIITALLESGEIFEISPGKVKLLS